MKRMAMEEPEKENIKLPFLQGCRIQLFNQNLCKRWAWQFEVKHYGFYTLGLCPVGISFFFFFQLIQPLSVRILPILHTESHCGDIQVDTTWAAKTSPVEAEKSSTWAYVDVSLYTLKQGFSTCLPVEWAGHPFVVLQIPCRLHFTVSPHKQ